MRQSLWPGLLMALQYNIKRQQQRVRLFEHGRVFKQYSELKQDPVISGIIYGNNYEEQWDNNGTTCDLYDVKADVEALIEQLGNLAKIDYRETAHQALHPGKSAQIFLDNQVIGLIGAIHPAILRAFDISQAVFAFELELSRFSEKKPVIFKKLSKFPSVRRDISILIDRQITAKDVISCIENSSSEMLTNLELFDLYQGEGIDLLKKSLTFGLTFQGSSSTLRDSEVEDMVDIILNTLHSEFGASLRE